MDPQKRQSSRDRETASFCSRFNTDPPRLEAERQSKSKQSPGNSSEIDAVLDWAGKWWMPLPVTQVVIDMLRSDELYCPSTNQVLPLLEQLILWTRDRVKQLQSPYFFRSLAPRYWPHHPYPRAFCSLPSFTRTKRPRWRTEQSTSTISRKNRGLWTVYIHSIRHYYSISLWIWIAGAEQTNLVGLHSTQREMIYLTRNWSTLRPLKPNVWPRFNWFSSVDGLELNNNNFNFYL